MNGHKTAIALLMVVMLPLSGCLGIFGDDSDDEGADSSSVDPSVGNETARQIESRSSGQFQNYTIPGQQDLDTQVLWLNGTLSTGDGAAAWEDRNDRSGTSYNTPYITEDLADSLPEGQPAEISVKMWYFPGPGESADLDVYVDFPGVQSDFSPSNCDEFSWKICVEERVVNTVGIADESSEVGVQVANGRVVGEMSYFMKVEIVYESNVVTPGQAYAFQAPEDATGLVVESEKAGGSQHVRTDFVVIGPDDELVEFVEYDDIAIPTESKLVSISEPGEYIVYPIEMEGGFLSVHANVPVPAELRQGRVLELTKNTVADASSPAPGTGETCIPVAGDACGQQIPWNGGDSSGFSIDGTFPLEITTWINEGGPNANLDAQIKVTSENGLVHESKKFVQYEDERGTIGSSRDEINTESNWANLAKGDYTVDYVIDGTGTVGHTVVTYQR